MILVDAQPRIHLLQLTCLSVIAICRYNVLEILSACHLVLMNVKFTAICSKRRAFR